MALDLAIRKLIKSYVSSGKTGAQIYEALNKTVKKRTIYNWINRINNFKTIIAKKQPGRPRNVRTKKFIAKIKNQILNNKKKKSARLIAKENGCDPKTVRLAIRNDLSLKPYKRIKVPALTHDHITQRKKFATWIRNNFNHEKCRKIMFSDEKVFDGDGQLNPKNDIIYAASREEANVNGGMKPKHKYPYKVMVWCGITYNGVTDVVVLPKGESFNSKFYIKKVIPIAKRDGIKLIGDDFIYQQDGASCHTSNSSMNALKNLMPSIILPNYWPANSPDLNPLDYFFWNEVAQRLTKKNFKNRQQLIGKIKDTVKEIPLKYIQDAIDEFRSRVYAVEKNDGKLILNEFK